MPGQTSTDERRRIPATSVLPAELREGLVGRRILVTGATGFIGTNVIRTLAEQGICCRGLVRQTSNRQTLDSWSQHIDLIIGDTLVPDSLSESCSGIDLCIHAAGTNAMNLTQSELRKIIAPTTQNVLEACIHHGVRKVVYISSCETIGATSSPDRLLNEQAPYNPRNDSLLFAAPYHEGEEIVARYVGRGLDVSIVNLLYVMAPGDRGKLFDGILNMGWLGYAMRGGFSLSLIDGVVEALLAAGVKGVPGQRYMVAGENVTYRNFTRRLRLAAGRRGPVMQVPDLLAQAASRLAAMPLYLREVLKYSGKYLYYDCTKASQDLGYRVPALDTVIQTVLQGTPRTPPDAHRKIR